MRILSKYKRWRLRRRTMAHYRWLRKSRVIFAKPHHSCERNKTESI